MYGDTTVIRGLARTLRHQAGDVRREADRLVGRAEHTAWSGLAGDAMRRRARERGAALRRAATLHEDAAEALERHAAEVDRLTELIAAIEARVRGLVEAARDRLAALGAQLLDGVGGLVDGVGGVVEGVVDGVGLGDLRPDPVDELLDRFVPPPSGSRAWLDLDLPVPLPVCLAGAA